MREKKILAFGDCLTDKHRQRPSVVNNIISCPSEQGTIAGLFSDIPTLVHILSYKDTSRPIEPVIVELECAGLPSANPEGESRERLETCSGLFYDRTKSKIERNMRHSDGIRKYLTVAIDLSWLSLNTPASPDVVLAVNKYPGVLLLSLITNQVYLLLSHLYTTCTYIWWIVGPARLYYTHPGVVVGGTYTCYVYMTDRENREWNSNNPETFWFIRHRIITFNPGGPARSGGCKEVINKPSRLGNGSPRSTWDKDGELHRTPSYHLGRTSPRETLYQRSNPTKPT